MPRARPIASGHFVDLGTFEAAGLAPRRARAYVPRAPSAIGARGAADAARPVVVLFDGQNVFDDAGSFAGGWHAHRTADRLAAPGPVIIAIDHGGAERIAELGAPSSTRLATFVDLIVDRVLPAAHARIALQYGPGAHFVGGSSMGGLAALYTHFRRSDVFGGAFCMSPSFWFERRAIFDFVAKEPKPYRSRIYLDAGAREGGGRLVGLVERMANHLAERGWRDHDRRLLFRVDARGTHREADWRRRLPKALRFLVGP